MKKLAAVVLFPAAITMLLFADGPAQRQSERGGGWHAGAAYSELYDPETVETVRGRVLRLDFVTPLNGMSPGVLAILGTVRGELPVHLGPAWFIENQNGELRRNEEVEITGSRIVMEGDVILMAALIAKDDRVFTLRHMDGFPIWSGWRVPDEGCPYCSRCSCGMPGCRGGR
jgi:hypothetical protein